MADLLKGYRKLICSPFYVKIGDGPMVFTITPRLNGSTDVTWRGDHDKICHSSYTYKMDTVYYYLLRGTWRKVEAPNG